jgi:DNA-binding NarL/FixJ family response regulator
MTQSAALLAYTQELLTTQEQIGRAERAARVMIYANSLSVREGLRALLERAGANVSLITIHASHVQVMLKAETGLMAVVTTLTDLSQIKTFVQQSNIPVLCLASTLRDGLALVDLAQQAELKMGIVLENPKDEAETLARLRSALRALAHGQVAIPNELQQPFAKLALSAQEQSVLALEVLGLSQNDIADRLGIESATVRQYRTRLAQKLEVENQSLREWAEAWWSAQNHS